MVLPTLVLLMKTFNSIRCNFAVGLTGFKKNSNCFFLVILSHNFAENCPFAVIPMTEMHHITFPVYFT